MSDVVALDIAVLPPPDVAARAVAISASLPESDSEALRLDDTHLPHITLTQMFARTDELNEVLDRVDGIVRGHAPLALQATGGGHGTHAVWIAIDKTPALVALHEQLMEALRGLERPDAGTGAFFEGDARLRDVLWVTGYRLKSSFHHYTPHITLGHGSAPPAIEPFAFTADTIAVCHLGRYCACRQVVRRWILGAG